MEHSTSKSSRAGRKGGNDESLGFDDPANVLLSEPERESDDDEDDEDVLLMMNRLPPIGLIGQQGVRFQKHHQDRHQPSGRLDSQQYIRPLVNNQLLQQQHQLSRLSRNSLLSSCRSMDFCYADERYTRTKDSI